MSSLGTESWRPAPPVSSPPSPRPLCAGGRGCFAGSPVRPVTFKLRKSFSHLINNSIFFGMLWLFFFFMLLKDVTHWEIIPSLWLKAKRRRASAGPGVRAQCALLLATSGPRSPAPRVRWFRPEAVSGPGRAGAPFSNSGVFLPACFSKGILDLLCQVQERAIERFSSPVWWVNELLPLCPCVGTGAGAPTAFTRRPPAAAPAGVRKPVCSAGLGADSSSLEAKSCGLAARSLLSPRPLTAAPSPSPWCPLPSGAPPSVSTVLVSGSPRGASVSPSSGPGWCTRCPQQWGGRAGTLPAEAGGVCPGRGGPAVAACRGGPVPGPVALC